MRNFGSRKTGFVRFIVLLLTLHTSTLHSLSCSDDFALLVSASHDSSIKTWRTTPRHPDPPNAPRVLAVTDTTGVCVLY